MLGQREQEIYGKLTLDEIIKYTEQSIKSFPIELEWFQSNIEGEIVGRLQKLSLKEDFDALIINPAAYSHTSVAIYDALKLLSIPIVEVHLSCVAKREDFRQVKLTGKAANIIMEGLGRDAYFLGIISQLTDQEREKCFKLQI